MTMVRLLTVCLLAIALPWLMPAAARAADPALEKIQTVYAGLKDIRGNFVQKSHIKDLDRTDTFKGTFSIKLPAKLKWQYQTDDKQQTEVFINQGTMMIYQKKEKQVLKGTFDRGTYGQAPIALLGGFGDIEKEFDVSKKGNRLILKPKKTMGAVTLIEIQPSDGPFPISGLTIIDRQTNRIDIIFKDVTVNSGIADAVFDFHPPKDVSVFDNQ